jgi:thiol-disulfide isomerase/thioredoxin
MSSELEEFLRSHAELVLINLWDDNCEASRYMEGLMGEIEHAKRIPVLRLHLAEHRDWARAHGVYGTPALVVYYRGRPLFRLLGRVTPAELLQRFLDFGL